MVRQFTRYQIAPETGFSGEASILRPQRDREAQKEFLATVTLFPWTFFDACAAFSFSQGCNRKFGKRVGAWDINILSLLHHMSMAPLSEEASKFVATVSLLSQQNIFGRVLAGRASLQRVSAFVWLTNAATENARK
jgi:hypothetical protein